MNISFIPHNSMKKFHENENVCNLVNLCLNHLDDSTFDDILFLIYLNEKNLFDESLNLLKDKYLKKGNIKTFNDFEDSLLNIYENDKKQHLRGAFLEVLSLNLFKRKYNFTDFSTDCNVKIGNFISTKTVDIAMKCESEGIVGECKISGHNFDEKVLSNLVIINDFSLNYFSLFIITLDNKERIFRKLKNIILSSDKFINLNLFNVIYRENFKDFYN